MRKYKDFWIVERSLDADDNLPASLMGERIVLDTHGIGDSLPVDVVDISNLDDGEKEILNSEAKESVTG